MHRRSGSRLASMPTDRDAILFGIIECFDVELIHCSSLEAFRSVVLALTKEYESGCSPLICYRKTEQL